MSVRFLKGLITLYLQVQDPISPWNLNLLLPRLMGLLLEPLASCSLLDLSLKVAFLVAITSARSVELRILMSRHPYTIFFRDKVCLHPHPKFLPKMVSSFHINQPIYMPILCPKQHMSREEEYLHTLDVRRALAFYLDRPRHFYKSSQLFIAIADRVRGQSVSTQRISSWIASGIRVCYDLANVTPSNRITVHSMRS